MDAPDDIHRGGLARTVFADKPQYTAGAQRKTDFVKYLDAKEALAQPFDLEQRCIRCW
jgi:hypothetical protein